MKRILTCLLLFVGFSAYAQHTVIVNPDGTHTIAVNHGHTTTIVNPDGTHTTAINHGHTTTIVNPDGSHTTAINHGRTTMITNPKVIKLWQDIKSVMPWRIRKGKKTNQ